MRITEMEPYDCYSSDHGYECSKSYHHKYVEDPSYPGGCSVHFMYEGSDRQPCGGDQHHHWHTGIWECESCRDSGVIFEGATASDLRSCYRCELGAEMKEFL